MPVAGSQPLLSLQPWEDVITHSVLVHSVLAHLRGTSPYQFAIILEKGMSLLVEEAGRKHVPCTVVEEATTAGRKLCSTGR